MDKNITITDVAEALGVSKTTVSRAISGKGRIGEATRKRVMDYIEEHDYKPNVIAQGLAKSRTFNLAVVMPTDYCLVDFPFFQNCLVGMHEMSSALEYDLLLTVCDNVDMSHLERIVSNRKVDGIVLMRTLVEDKVVRLLPGRGIPFVVVGSTHYKKVIQIDQNHREACKEMTSILLMKKMKRIALVGGSENYVVTQSRLKGYLDAHAELGIPVQNELVFLNQDTPMMVENAVDLILQRNVDCIACMDDGICVNVLNKLKKEHICIPEDMKVASYFNSTVLENHIPSITSLDFDVKEEGRVAIRTLIDMIEGMEVESRVLPGYDVVLKDSTK